MNLDNVKSNPNAQIYISMNDGEYIVQGLVKDELQIGGTATFSQPFESTAVDTLNAKLGSTFGAANILRETLNSVGGGLGIKIPNVINSQIHVKNLIQTIQSWTGTSNPTFSVGMLFLATEEGDDPREDVKTLLRAVYPTRINEWILQAPLGYLPSTEGALGTSLIRVGTWFQANNQIITDVSFSFSKEVVSYDDGATSVPLYAEGRVQFMPYRMATYEDVVGYISGIDEEE